MKVWKYETMTLWHERLMSEFYYTMHYATIKLFSMPLCTMHYYTMILWVNE